MKRENKELEYKLKEKEKEIKRLQSKIEEKKERIYRRKYESIEDVKRDVFDYIEMFYNRRRLHSVLRYMSPVEYRLKYDIHNIT